MNTTALARPPRTPSGPEPPSDRRRSARASERPTFREMLAEIVPLIEFIPAYGPPGVFVLGPWLFLVLILAGPLGWLFALVVAIAVAATVLAALAAAILAGPYLLVRRLRRHRARHEPAGAPAARVVTITSPRAAA